MIKAYSQRRMSPFRGLRHVIAIEGADAVSDNGVDWELTVQAAQDDALGDSCTDYLIPPADVLYGRWSPTRGFRRHSVRLVNESDAIEALGSQLLEAVASKSKQLPFPLIDRFECWLVDTDGDLVALLDSAVEHRVEHAGAPPLWTLGQGARESFCLGQEDRCRRLIKIVNGDGDFEAVWITRHDDGSGVRQSDDDQRWPASAFPELLLRRQWADPDDDALVEAFLQWQAPLLLMLPGLSDDTRAALEPWAWQQTRWVAGHYRAYPRVIDIDGLKEVLVRVRLEESARLEARDGEEESGDYFVGGS